MHATPKCTNRLFEWAATAIMLHIGVGALIAVHVFGVKVVGALNALIYIGLDTAHAGALITMIGLLRALALYANGRWLYGPFVRALGCAAGMFVWMQFEFGVITLMVVDGRLYIAACVWNVLTFFEFFSIIRALLDYRGPSILHALRATLGSTVKVGGHVSRDS